MELFNLTIYELSDTNSVFKKKFEQIKDISFICSLEKAVHKDIIKLILDIINKEGIDVQNKKILNRIRVDDPNYIHQIEYIMTFDLNSSLIKVMLNRKYFKEFDMEIGAFK